MNLDNIIAVTIVIINIACASHSCISDHQHRTISNRICKLLFITNIIAAFYYGYGIQSVTITSVIFFILIIIWLIGAFGAGDIKLLCAFSVGIKPELTLACLVSVGLIGGLQLVVMFLIGLMTKTNIFEKGIPYGIPISISGVAFTALSLFSW